MTVPLKYLRYTDVAGYLKTFLTGRGYGAGTLAMPKFDEGPTDPQAWKTSPQAVVFISLGGGPGLVFESTFDRTFINLRIISRQRDRDGGRELAMACDRGLLALGANGLLGSTYALGVDRSGGSPTLLMRDSAERYHFVATYITTAETGI